MPRNANRYQKTSNQVKLVLDHKNKVVEIGQSNLPKQKIVNSAILSDFGVKTQCFSFGM